MQLSSMAQVNTEVWMGLEAPTAPSVFRQGHSYLSNGYNCSNENLLAHLKDTELEELGSTFWEMLSNPRGLVKPCYLFGKLLQEAASVSWSTTNCEPRGCLSLGGIQQEELDRPFPSRILENQHTFEPCYISLATMTFRWPCFPVWE